MSERKEAAIVLNVGDVIWARPCVVTITCRVGQVAYGACAVCEVDHIIDRASYEAGMGPWQPADNASPREGT